MAGKFSTSTLSNPPPLDDKVASLSEMGRPISKFPGSFHLLPSSANPYLSNMAYILSRVTVEGRPLKRTNLPECEGMRAFANLIEELSKAGFNKDRTFEWDI